MEEHQCIQGILKMEKLFGSGMITIQIVEEMDPCCRQKHWTKFLDLLNS